MRDEDRTAGSCDSCGGPIPATAGPACPHCGAALDREIGFRNSDARLTNEAAHLIEERSRLGLDGLVGGLEYVVINVEANHHRAAVEELLARTGLTVDDAFADDVRATVVLRAAGSADVLVTARRGPSPFEPFTDRPKARALPRTRLETFGFRCVDLDAYERIQRSRGVRFMTAEPGEGRGFRLIQTEPSAFTGNSLGLIERIGAGRSYRTRDARDLVERFDKPERTYLDRIGRLDHAATRVRAAQRDDAILEFIGLTNYRFDFAIYVKSLNSITNAARLSADDFAMVFTSGIAPYVDETTSGPTERFIHDYGPRVHHLAWDTTRIDDTFAGLKRDGQEFLLDLVGSPAEGLKQTFSTPSRHTLLVNEYIHRFGDFDGFFTRSNVTLLTEATSRQ